MLFFGVPVDLTIGLLSFSIWSSSGEANGAGLEAFRCEEIFPLEMT